MPVSGKEAIKRLRNLGFTVARQRGSHVVLTRYDGPKKWTTVVPLHKELKRGTIRSVTKLAGIDVSLLEK